VGEPIRVDAETRSIQEWSKILEDALNEADARAAKMLGARAI